MKLLVILLVLFAACAARPAAADPFVRHAGPSQGALAGSIVVPAEWAGVWETVDSVYSCAGVLQSTSSRLDTLCAGQVFESDSSAVCTGSFDAGSYTQHCTSTGEVFTDCQYTITLDAHGTRTADSFSSVAVTTVQYSGTAEGCNLLPPQCTQIDTHGTRLSPAPAEYCATPARATSWGRMKALYR